MRVKTRNILSISLPLENSCPWNIIIQEQFFYCLVILHKDEKMYTTMTTKDISGWLDTVLIHKIYLNCIIIILIFIMLAIYKCQNQKSELAANEIQKTHRKHSRLK